jgi:hypothetical protein
MPITSSGEIALIADIEAEFDQTGTEDISLIQAATDAGLSTTDASMFSFYSASDVALSSVTTNSASSVTASSMVLNGNLTNTGGGSITSHGFYFGTDAVDYTQNTKIDLGAKGSTGTFSNSRTGLSGATTYYITAFAVNGAGESVGSTVARSTAWGPATANLGSSSRMSNTIPNTISSHVHYYQQGYSGTFFHRYNTTAAAYTGTRYFGSFGPTDTIVYTNATNRHVTGVEGVTGTGNLRLILARAGSYTFQNCSIGIYFGGGTLSGGCSSTAPFAKNTISSVQSYVYCGITYRYQ